MRCLFCKSDSTNSRAVEHIIPEALGNTTATLPPGVVCDNCNNYFARKVEKPFLESEAIVSLRFHQENPSKRGLIPPIQGIIPSTLPVTVIRSLKEPVGLHIYVPPEAAAYVSCGKPGSLIIPEQSALPARNIVSRFLAKAALETLAERLLDAPEGLEHLVEESQLDAIRSHARRGSQPDWPFSARRIYEANQTWTSSSGNEFQVLHEFDILVTNSNEWYFVLALFGLELTINCGGPDLEGYYKWLKENGGGEPITPPRECSRELPMTKTAYPRIEGEALGLRNISYAEAF